MNSVIITSGNKYIDIDAYASCIAYAILLRAANIPAKAVTTAPLNESIPDLIKKINLSFEIYEPMANDDFILLDVSNPDMFDSIVRIEKIIRVIDHHTGYEDFWKEKELSGEIAKAEIEYIGSVCTNIYEKFVECNKTNLLTEDLCKLLTVGILDNTLNLKASITTERDIKAYYELIKIGNLSDAWSNEYFSACEEEILKDLEIAILNDIKIDKENRNLPNVFGQLTIYNSVKVLEQIELIKKVFKNYSEWMINIISLEDGKSYIITDSEKSKQDLEKLFNLKFNGDVLILDKFMLRKEIIKKASKLYENETTIDKKRITILDNEVYLRQVSKDVDFNDRSYIDDIKYLKEYCKNNIVWAMAAVQIGIPKRIIYLKNTTSDSEKNYDSNYDEAKVLINPVVIERKGHTRFLEACESCLDNVGVIDRPFLVVVEYYDINGELKKETFRGFESTVLSHEYDHLDGILHLDLIDEDDKMQLNLEQRKAYREQHPYEIISETCNYDNIRSKRVKKDIFN